MAWGFHSKTLAEWGKMSLNMPRLNTSCPPTPGERLGVVRALSTRRRCALRSALPRPNVITKATLTFICLLAPLLVRASPLDVYGNLLQKTVLMPSAMPYLPEAITADLPTEKTNAIAWIESELSKRGIAVVQDGPHFVLVVPEHLRGFLTNVAPYVAEPATSKSQLAMPGGAIDFAGADLGQVLPIYAALSQGTILRPMTLPSPVVRLKSNCPLSLEEAVYAMSTILALNGIAVVEDGERFVQVVPMAQRAHVRTRAPKPEPGARLFDPKKVPSTGVTDFPRPLTEMERIEQEYERLRIEFYHFIHYKGPPERPAKRLLEFYASLAGKTAEASRNFDTLPIWFHIETPVSKADLLYAIETTFALNSLAIVHLDEQRIRVGHISEQGKGTGKQDANPNPKQ